MTEPSLVAALELCTQRCRDMDAPLPTRLAAMADDVRRLAPQFADIVDRMVGRLQQGAAGVTAPAVGEPMPPFVLPNENGQLVSLSRLLESGQVVISFNRGHWCPYCRINADGLAKIEPDVRAAGGQIVLITPELQRHTKRHKADAKATFPILTDLDSGYALALHLAIRIDDEKRTAMTQAGWDISEFQGNDNWTLPIPATFIVGQDGIIKSRFVDPDYRKRMDLQKLLAALRE